MQLNQFNIFRRGSRTYFYSSLLFPSQIRDDVFVLYSFVRTADNFVDILPQKKAQFYKFKTDTLRAFNISTDDPIIGPFIMLSKKYNFNKDWIKSFLEAMERDLKKKRYQDIKELEEYMYGSSEVIGLMMASIMKVPKKALPYAKTLGKSMQLINFIRDINEDLELGRSYLPLDEINQFGLRSLKYSETINKRAQFESFINFQIKRFRRWQKRAEKGFSDIPIEYLTAVKTASDLYKWTAQVIEKDPFAVYKRKVKPSAIEIIQIIGRNIFL